MLSKTRAEEIASRLTGDRKCQWFEAACKVRPWIRQSSADFADSLITAYRTRGDLSVSQWTWLIKLTSEAMSKAPSAALSDIYMNP